jgi:hypothetical protein
MSQGILDVLTLAGLCLWVWRRASGSAGRPVRRRCLLQSDGRMMGFVSYSLERSFLAR